MKLAAVLCLGAVVAAKRPHPVRQEIVDAIRERTDRWQPREVAENHLAEVPVEMLEKKLGYLGNQEGMASKGISWMNALYHMVSPKYEGLLAQDSLEVVPMGSPDYPKHFDAREAWPGCVGAVRDQMYCGSCWAFSSAAML